MKAAVYYETGPPSVFRYEDVPDPVCHPRGVIIEVKAVSIEGGDVLNRAGGMMTAKPHIVGYQAGGVIREVGAEVTDRRVGQRVVAINAQRLARGPVLGARERHLGAAGRPRYGARAPACRSLSGRRTIACSSSAG